jgi:hypothetical protein
MKPRIGVEPRFAESSGDGDDYWTTIERHRPDTAATSTRGGIIQPDRISASQMIGSSVYSVQNVDIGKVQDLILPWRPAGLGCRLQYRTASVTPCLSRAVSFLSPVASHVGGCIGGSLLPKIFACNSAQQRARHGHRRERG